MRFHEILTGKRAALVILVLAGLFLAVGCGGMKGPAPNEALPEAGSEAQVSGFLKPDNIPDSLSLLPPPPQKGSADFAADEEAYRATRALRNTPRWTLAVRDANLNFPGAPEAFSCAVDIPITRTETPHLYDLMRRSLVDSARVTFAAKDHYRRVRPFVVNKESTCTPEYEPELMKNGSYPSGHSSIGWTWALILTELAPGRENAILSRGYAFGENRVVCGVHWQSDVTAGRVVASSLVARLHADPVFRKEMAAAGAEIAAARAGGLKPDRDCRWEAEAMTYGRPHSP